MILSRFPPGRRLFFIQGSVRSGALTQLRIDCFIRSGALTLLRMDYLSPLIADAFD